MLPELTKVFGWFLALTTRGDPGHLWPRWLWLRALGLIFFSAFYSWFFQIRGLIGPEGILPAGPWLAKRRRAVWAETLPAGSKPSVD